LTAVHNKIRKEGDKRREREKRGGNWREKKVTRLRWRPCLNPAIEQPPSKTPIFSHREEAVDPKLITLKS